MARSQKNPLLRADGFLAVDKPAGLSSAQVVGRIKHLSRPERVGHAGTLDPFATGLLVICFNQATKLAGYLLEGDKVYAGVMRLGVETETQDPTGKVIRRAPVLVGPEEIVAASERFIGRISQKPPAFSALKKDGERLYKKARRGEEVDLPAREVMIHRLEITAIESDQVTFEVHCSKGTYIRALASDWGRALGCGGLLESLRRLAVGPFNLDTALLLDQVEALATQGDLEKRLIPPAEALPGWPRAVLAPQAADKVSHGQALSSGELGGLKPQFLKAGQHLLLTNRLGRLIALAQISPSGDEERLSARPIRVLHA